MNKLVSISSFKSLILTSSQVFVSNISTIAIIVGLWQLNSIGFSHFELLSYILTVVEITSLLTLVVMLIITYAFLCNKRIW